MNGIYPQAFQGTQTATGINIQYGIVIGTSLLLTESEARGEYNVNGHNSVRFSRPGLPSLGEQRLLEDLPWP
jgi:hypothetical protein